MIKLTCEIIYSLDILFIKRRVEMNNRHLSHIVLIIIVIFVTLSMSASSPPTHWQETRVDAGTSIEYMTNSSLKTYNGVASVVYGADHLYYAIQAPSEDFVITTVDQSMGVGRYASLAIEPTTGHARISYYDETNEHLKYAREYASGLGHAWTITTVDSDDADPGGNKTAIALDSTSYHAPHIAYTKLDGHVWHAWQTCSGSPPFIICEWHTEEVDDVVVAGGTNITMALDSNNHPHLAYYDSTTHTLHYAVYDGSDWSYGEVPDTGSYYGLEPSLAIDTNDRPAIAYRTSVAIRYAWKTGDNWDDWAFSTVYVDSGAPGVPTYPSLLLLNNNSDFPYISFIDADYHVRLAYWDEMDPSCPGTTGELACPVVDNRSDFMNVTSLAREYSSGTYYYRMVYMNEHTGELHYLYENSVGWNDLYVDMDIKVGQFSSIKAFLNGAHISYYDSSSTGLKYTQAGNSKPGSCGIYGMTTGYECQFSDNPVSTEDLGQGTSLIVDRAGDPHIAYYDYGNQLKFAYNTGTWTVEVIDSSSSDVGEYPALAINSDSGDFAIAYKDSSTGYLRYAEELSSPWTGGNCGPSNHWKCSDVEYMTSAGNGIDLAIDRNGIPHISYIHGVEHLVHVAKYVGSGGSCANTAWQCTEVTEDGHYTEDGETSIYADPFSDTIMLSFYNTTVPVLMFAYFDPESGWSHEVVDGVGVGRQNELAVVDGTPFIAYLDENTFDLKLAERVGWMKGDCGENHYWHCETLDSAGNVGFDPSISYSSDGRIYISYYDATNGDLKLLNQMLPAFLPLINKP
jgi:hypothetical protein